MAVEQTLSIIKPDAVGKNVIGQIYAMFEQAGLSIVAAQHAATSPRSRRASSTPCTRSAPSTPTW